MKGCACGQPVARWGLYDVCHTCLREYLTVLPERPGLRIAEWQREHHQHAHSAVQGNAAPAPRVRLLDAPLDAVTLADTLAWMRECVERNRAGQIVTLNVDLIKITMEHKRFRTIVNNAALSVADGKPLLWAARWTKQHLPARITGTDLVLGAAQQAHAHGETIFFLGAAPGVAAKAAAAVQEQFPGVQIAHYSPPMGTFSAEDNARMVEMIRASGATYLFVALGSPRGQVWLDEHLPQLGVAVCAEIGGVFNFLAGTIKRAPRWMQQSGLEWAYRIGQEPQRLWRRYLVDDLPVFLHMLRQTASPLTTTIEPTSVAPAALTREHDMPGALLESAIGGS